MLPLSKLANKKDFSSIELKETAAAFELPALTNRKSWEMAMALYGFDSNMNIKESTFLGVGAGKEPTIASLSKYSQHVTATDLYADPKDWLNEAPTNILFDPEKFFDKEVFRKDRVTFKHADGRYLPFENETFDGIFSCSSIEHFGNTNDIIKAADEMRRVLVRDGIASISTEYRLNGPAKRFGNIFLFDDDLIEQVFPSDYWLIQNYKQPSIDDIVSCLEQEEPTDFARYVREPEYQAQHHNHMILSYDEFVWTSIHLTIQKR